MSTYHNIYQDNIAKNEEELLIDKNQKDAFILMNYLNTVISTFKWKNLPEHTLPFMPEEQLCFTGRTAFFKDDEGNYKMFPCFMAGNLLENGLYSSYQIIARNGKVWTRKVEDIEICYNNSIRLPSTIQIFALAEDASYTLRAIRASLRRSMIPPILAGATNEELEAISKMLDCEFSLKPFFVAFKDLVANGDIEKIDFFDNAKEDVLSKWDIFVRQRNLFYTTFGINNVEIQKKERLTEAEGSGNDEITRYTLLQDMYNCRKDFCERVKKHFDYDLSFSLNRDSATVYETNLETDEKIDNMELTMLRGVNLKGQEETNETEKADKEIKKEEAKNE